MTCNTPPFVHAAWLSADHIAPNRNHAIDGGCPSLAHHQNNPTSDHEPSGPNNYCHAVDVMNDPPQFDPRDYLGSIIANPYWRRYLKYIVANFTGWHGHPRQEDLIWDFGLGDTHWRVNGGYSHLEAPHTHFSFYPSAEQITTPLFIPGAPPVPAPGSAEGDPVFVVQPVNVPPGKRAKLTGRTMGADLDVAGRRVVLHNGSAVRGDAGTADPLMRTYSLAHQPGNPRSIGPAASNRPGGPGCVVCFDNHITIDLYWS